MMLSLKKLFYIVAGFRRRYVSSMLIGAVAVAFDTFSIVFFGSLVASTMGTGDAANSLKDKVAALGIPTSLTVLVSILMAVYLAKSALLIFFSRSVSRFALDLRSHLQRKMLNGILREIPYRELSQTSSAEFTHKTMQVVHVFTMELMLQASIGMINAATGLLIFVYLLMVSPEPTVVLTVVFALIGLAYMRFFSRTLKEISWNLNHYVGRLFALFSGSVYAAKETRIHGLDQKYLEIVDGTLDRVSREQVRFNTIQVIPRVAFEVLLCLAFLVFAAGSSVAGGTSGELMTQFSIFLIAAMKMLPASSQILNAIALLNANFTTVSVVYDELTELDRTAASRANEPEEDVSVDSGASGVTFRNVVFAYTPEKTVLKDISLEIAARRVTGICGPSGGGKSTFLDILLGLLAPDSGQVLIGGHDLVTCKKSWRAGIGYMSQNLFLLDDTIAENLKLTDSGPGLDTDLAIRCLTQVGLADFAASDGLQFRIGERGTKLSGGQRQRLVFARLLYSRKSVLILDEPTASLDGAAEEAVIQCIQGLKSDRTLIIVSHSETLLRECDIVYEIRNGSARLAQDFRSVI